MWAMTCGRYRSCKKCFVFFVFCTVQYALQSYGALRSSCSSHEVSYCTVVYVGAWGSYTKFEQLGRRG